MLSRRLNNRSALGWALDCLAIAQSVAGDLASSKATLEESIREFRGIGDKESLSMVLFDMVDLFVAQGDLVAAKRAGQESRALAEEIGARHLSARSSLWLGRLAIEEGQPAEAEGPVREAAEQFKRGNLRRREAQARHVLAQCLYAQQKQLEAASSIERATALLKDSEWTLDRLPIAITAARVRAVSGKEAEALMSLESVLAEATQRRLVGLQLEARLALGEIELRAGSTEAGRARLEALQKEAEQRGYGLIARKAATALGD